MSITWQSAKFLNVTAGNTYNYQNTIKVDKRKQCCILVFLVFVLPPSFKLFRSCSYETVRAVDTSTKPKIKIRPTGRTLQKCVDRWQQKKCLETRSTENFRIFRQMFFRITLFCIILKIRRKICGTVVFIQFRVVIYNAQYAAEKDKHEVFENIALGVILSFKRREIIYKQITEIYKYKNEVSCDTLKCLNQCYYVMYYVIVKVGW